MISMRRRFSPLAHAHRTGYSGANRCLSCLAKPDSQESLMSLELIDPKTFRQLFLDDYAVETMESGGG